MTRGEWREVFHKAEDIAFNSCRNASEMRDKQQEHDFSLCIKLLSLIRKAL